MKYTINSAPIFQELTESKSILIAGAGGGFDIFCGIPLYFYFKKLGKKVILANFSFTWLNETTSQEVTPFCYKVQSKDQDLSGRNYFPEKLLKIWLENQHEEVDVYAFEKTGVIPLTSAYNYIIDTHELDTIILVDGGTDSLMLGDEDGLGTPQEDICSMAAVFQSKINKHYLLSVGFGIDHFHGVSHYRFLENVAHISKEGGYLGIFQLLNEMEGAQYFKNAILFANKRMNGKESIVSNSILSALEGEYGNQHRTQRTIGSELWINPLMTIYWCFELGQIIKQIKYYDDIKDVKTIGEFNKNLYNYRNGLDYLRKKKQLPI